MCSSTSQEKGLSGGGLQIWKKQSCFLNRKKGIFSTDLHISLENPQSVFHLQLKGNKYDRKRSPHLAYEKNKINSCTSLKSFFRILEKLPRNTGNKEDLVSLVNILKLVRQQLPPPDSLSAIHTQYL